MKIEQLYTNCLAQGAYYIESNGQAAIIDPLRDVQPYIKLAEQRGALIKYVFETHFHADFVSGHVELAHKTGASIVFGPTSLKTGFDAIIAQDNQKFVVGDAVITLLHTPGHTMESACYKLTNELGEDVALFTGDTLFLGDVGRPDLAQKVIEELTQEKLASMLFHSLRNKIMPLPDHLIVYPGHGKGSACGKMMSDKKEDTLGNQKKENYALDPDLSENEFVSKVLSGLTSPPGYFPQNVLQNVQGAMAIDQLTSKALRGMSPKMFQSIAYESDVFVLDTRKESDFVAEHIPNAINIGLSGDFAVWVGTMFVNLNTQFVIVADDGKEMEVITRLARVGFDNVQGFLNGGMTEWTKAGFPIETTECISADELAQALTPETLVLDVRRKSEYEAQHLVGALNIPLDYIQGNLLDVDKGRKTFVYCAAGYRSLIFVSYLKQLGFTNLINLIGGFESIKSIPELELTNYVCPTTML
jgi:glyoxylase-like metal-dependent hydrolase (beta-lactamase superfamily II)/rhodanese-related sulfurtransferase